MSNFSVLLLTPVLLLSEISQPAIVLKVAWIRPDLLAVHGHINVCIKVCFCQLFQLGSIS